MAFDTLMNLMRPLVSSAHFLVDPRNWSSYEVSHRNLNTLDCRVVNLEPQESGRHRSEGRLGWSKKSMSHDEKVRGVAQILKKIAGTIAPPPRKGGFLSLKL